MIASVELPGTRREHRGAAELAGYDLCVVGAGPAGLMAAIGAASRGARVALCEQQPSVGGALLINRGQISAAGTRVQRERGIEDSAAAHLRDIVRLSGGTADVHFAKTAVELQGPLLDWLVDHGFEMPPDMPRIIHGQEAYSTARTYWGRREGHSLLEVLQPMLEAAIAAQRIELFMPARVLALRRAGDAGIAGVQLADGRCVEARRTLLATGGYGANPELFAKLHPGQLLRSGAYVGSDGSGLEMALEVGATLAHAETYAPGFGGILDHTLDPPRYRSFGGLTPQDREQWEIVVNRAGERFYAEDGASVEQRARALARQAQQMAWVIFDERIRREAPPLFHYFGASKATQFFERSAAVRHADSLRELAERCGIEPGGLERTIARYNAAVRGEAADELGRRFLPCPIVEPPFHAVEIVSYAVRSFGGLRADHAFRVLDRRDAPIEGLYAVGEVLGNFIVRHGSAGGMALTPALAFGKWLGEQLAAQPRAT